MEQNTDSSTAGLENQLRGMILGNVRIGDNQPDQNTHAARGRGRGRGRPFWRGNQDRPVQGQGQQANPSPSPTFPRRGGAPDARGRGYRQHGPQSGHHAHPNSGTGQGGSASNRGGAQASRVLQRPHGNFPPHYPRQQGQYQPQSQVVQPRENPMVQIEHLDRLAAEEIPKVEMSLAEFEEKEAFRAQLEGTFRQAFAEGYPSTGDIATISLVGFGSLASGFGMPGSDMDLAVVPGWKDPSRADQIGIDRDIPRLLERAVLDAKMGGRLLTRTRVPILKVCEKPTDELYTALFEERKKWDDLPSAEQYPTDLSPTDALPPGRQLKRSQLVASGLYPPPKPVDALPPADKPISGDEFPELGTGADKKKKKAAPKPPTQVEAKKLESSATTVESPREEPATESNPKKQQGQQPRGDKGWMREKVLGPLDFPKDGVGIQCDINFENPLGIHNTHMLRCYSMTDPRVRPIVLFVKSWAKRRKINSSYSGTLNSYGWVLMVLHYLVNIAQPPVCPNLQHSIPKPTDLGQLENFFKDPIVGGYIVRFWRNEQEIMQAAQSGQLTNNRQSVGELLRGFFQYYASLSSYNNYGPRPPQFYWTNEVLSLRTPGGIRSKQDKGWVSAKTTITAEKKVTNRYLFAIEDPFELDHNVARTVTHRGIVAIRDEFRRAWRILGAIGKGMEPQEGGIFDEVVEGAPPTKEAVDEMWKEIVSPRPTEDGVQAATTESATTESVVAV